MARIQEFLEKNAKLTRYCQLQSEIKAKQFTRNSYIFSYRDFNDGNKFNGF